MSGQQANNNGSTKRFGPWPVIVIVVLASWWMTRTGNEVQPVFCDPTASEGGADVVMLSADWCPYCRRARRLFVEKGIDYCEHDIEKSVIGRNLYQRSKHKVIPIITIKDDVLVGFSKDQILQTLASHDLYPLEKI